MKTIWMTTAALALGLAGSALAAAQEGHHGGHGMRGHHMEGPGRADGPRRPGAGLAMLQLADLDGDRTVTRAEVEDLASQEFAFRDRNGDGVLDEQDASPMMRRMRALHSERAEMHDEAGGEGRRWRHRRGGAGAERGDRNIDADGDGRITREEFISHERPLFDRLDTNSDGSVTPDELDAAVEQMREGREGRRMWWRG